MRNQYAVTLKTAKENAYIEGIWSGIQMGCNLCAIALNHKYGFGDKRLHEIEKEVSNLADEIVRVNDPELTKQRIEKALKQIRGQDFDVNEEIPND